jgi:hypothetical protein
MQSSGIQKPCSYLTGDTIHLRSGAQPVRFNVYTAVTMKNAVFWDIKTCSYLTKDKLRLRFRYQPVNAMKDVRFIWRDYEECRLLVCDVI